MAHLARKPAMGKALLLIFVLALAACRTPPPENKFPELTWAHKQPYRLAVAEVIVDQQYRPRLDLPNVESRAPLPPVKGAADWAADRLQAVGSAGSARFVILEGSILRSDLQTKSGLSGLFSNEQSRRYDAHIAVELSVTDGLGNQVGKVFAEARHHRTVPESATLNERERILFQLVEATMRELDAQLDQTIPVYLRGSLR